MKKKLFLLMAVLCCFVLAVGILAACNGDQGTQPGGQTPGGQTPGGMDNPGDIDQPGGDQPDENDYTEGLVFKLASDGESYSVTDYTGTSTEVVIPSVYEGLPVKSIGSFAFNYNTMVSVFIPDSVTSISSEAFNFTYGLTSIIVDEENPVYHSAGNCLIKTETKALIAGCSNCIIPDDGSVTSIGRYAFAGNKGLTNIIIPDSITSISSNAFAASGLKSIELPSGLKSISQELFYNCKELTSVIIPDGVESIGRYAFMYCSKLGSVTIPDSVTTIELGAFYKCTGLTSVAIGNEVKEMEDGAFSDCTSLTSITIPKSVTRLEGAFSRCSALSSIAVEEGNTRYYSAGNCLINTENKDLILGCKNSIIPDDGSVTGIAEYAFENCIGLTTVIIPEGVTSIGTNAFHGCSGLTSVTIPKSMTHMTNGVFADCSSLTTVTFKGTVAEWKAIYKGIMGSAVRLDWNEDSPFTEVVCSDGAVSV